MTQLLLPVRNSPHCSRQAQAENERMKTDISGKWNLKAREQPYSYLTKQTSSQTNQKRQRMSFHIDKGNNLSRRYNNCKHICTKHWHTQFHTTNCTGHKDRLAHTLYNSE
jgi:regulator of replication initiation timing